MSKKIYKKDNKGYKKLSKLLGVLTVGIGILIIIYVFFPLISWQIYFAPVFAKQNIEAPIPKTTVVDSSSIRSILANFSSRGTDYTNAKNWFPGFQVHAGSSNAIPKYTISIPKINVENAVVSTIDTKLDQHMVQLGDTPLPPQKGNPIVFGHSTLPQLYNPKDYKTILANAYKLETGDEFTVTVDKIIYKYRVYQITVVDPEDTSALEQNKSDSFFTLITCTPPGTTWKRLVIKARLEKL